MELLTAIIRRARVKTVVDALLEQGIKGVTVTEVRGFGEQKGGYRAHTLPHSKLEMVVEDDQIEGTFETIIRTARTGEPGDGIMYVYSLGEVCRIRSGKAGPDAI